MVTQAMKDAAMATKQSWIDRGYPADLSGKGYFCQPNTSVGGYCHIRCDGGGSAGSGDSTVTVAPVAGDVKRRRWA